MNRKLGCLLVVGFLAAVSGCPRDATTPATNPALPPATAPTPAVGDRVEADGLHNVFRLSEKLYSGSSPQGDEGFRSLQKLGVKTIVSVDGARPDVETARKYGIRYVHLPVGYDGFTQDQALQLSKAAHDLPGPIYFHCHHGKHRGPAAAAVAHLALDEQCTVEDALAELRRAGTDPHYTGLYAAPSAFQRPSAKDLAALPTDFPEVTPPKGLVPFMVDIDDRMEHLKAIRAAGWKVPADQPDLDPPHEALQLCEQLREAGRLPAVKDRPEAFRRLLADAIVAAGELETALRVGREKTMLDSAAAEKAYVKLNAGCAQCHAQSRDVPK